MRLRGGWQAALALGLLLGSAPGVSAEEAAEPVAAAAEPAPVKLAPADPALAEPATGPAPVEPAAAGLPVPVEPAAAGAETPPAAPPPAASPALANAAPALAQEPDADLLPLLSDRWRAGGPELHARIESLREVAAQRGIANLEPAARLLLLDESLGTRVERARAAIELAPALPATHAALATALLFEQADPAGAFAAALTALRVLPDHLDASLWVGAVGLWGLSWALASAGLGFLLLCAARSVLLAAHDLGDRLERQMPRYARVAALGALILLPATIGEGPFGLGLAAFGIAFAYGSSAQRFALVGAAALVVVGLHPAGDRAGRYLAAPGSDAVAESAWTMERGVASSLEAQRLGQAGDDPLALQARALEAKRAGDLVTARERYAALLAAGSADPAVLNNAANVHLALGEVDAAIGLYRQATAQSESAAVWFNLAQAYGRAIRVSEHAEALARAQQIDERAVRELTERFAGSRQMLVTDLPLSAEVARAQLLDGEGGRVAAAAVRRPFAPGRLGSDPRAMAAAFVAAALVAWLLVRGFRASANCRRCGTLLCPRCVRGAKGGLCEGCARMLQRPETIDPKVREVRARGLAERARLRARWYRAVAFALPGAAGVFGDRPLLGLVAVTLFAGAWGGMRALGPSLPDPFAAGATGPLVFGSAALVQGLGYVVTTLMAYSLCRSGDGS